MSAWCWWMGRCCARPVGMEVITGRNRFQGLGTDLLNAGEVDHPPRIEDLYRCNHIFYRILLRRE